MIEKIQEINRIIKEWNPLGVVGPALEDEYLGLVPSILKLKTEFELENFIISELDAKYGIDCKDENGNSNQDLTDVVNKLSKVLSLPI